MSRPGWKFFIDVGGTFTDVVAQRPDGRPSTFKLLSSGLVRGAGSPDPDGQGIVDARRIGDPRSVWIGYRLSLLDWKHRETASATVTDFDPKTGTLHLDGPLSTRQEGPVAYALATGEPAPVVAIRYLMGIGLSEAIGPVDVRLGTTRATNALLERAGARVAFVTTRGFGDILKIGYQDRPELFDLQIIKRDELAECVIEIDERLAADGAVLQSVNVEAARTALGEARRRGIEGLAICLLHAHVNDRHERLVGELAREVGFAHVSLSSQVSRIEGIVPRGDTTVADAYLRGVIVAYVAAIRQSLPEATFRLMTSSGGLVAAEHVHGKDTVLSGPAGGVIGCSFTAHRAGVDRAIGFDMGGTSTDVSRIEAPPDPFEYQHETVKAGIRLKTPMLAVETVAAGGGSLCRFDGQKLIVGPQSAGAEPGPACYGRGGPLTVTDMNVMLGRILPELFPFPLDRRIVESKVGALCATITQATGTTYTPEQLALGFLQIANARMAAAIKRISLAKGYDVREYALCAFGGAGGQHACAIAEALGIRRILISPYAGVLSALGIGVAQVRRMDQRSVNFKLEEDAIERTATLLESMGGRLRDALESAGDLTSQSARTRQTMDLGYQGQSTLLTVPVTDYSQARTRFEELHRQLYGYTHQGRAIEIRVLRTELIVESADLNLPRPDAGPADRGDPVLRPVVFGAARHMVPVCRRDQLAVDKTLAGPCVILDDTGTIVVDPHWHGRQNEHGDLILEWAGGEDSIPTMSSKADPIGLELFNQRFAAIAAQMGATLRRTALSTNVKERLDFSCALFTPSGDLVVNAPHIPVHLGAMSHCVKALIEDVATFSPQDVYITNDPYRGGSHLNDVTVVTPVHARGGGKLLFFVASRAHHAEIGGTRPGSMPPDSINLAQEGVLIRAFRWSQDRPATQTALRRLLAGGAYPSRNPDENIADITAQIAANVKGVRDVLAMVDQYTYPVVGAYMRHIQAAAAEKMRGAILRLTDGTFHATDCLDDGTRIELRIDIQGDHATLDFTGTAPVHPGNLNANPAIVTSAVLYCLRCLIDEDIPLNAGVLEPVDIILPECFLNPAAHADPSRCPAVVGGNVETSQRIVDCIFAALGVVAASQGTMNNLLFGNESFGYYETICGGSGAGPGFHGADAVHTHMTNTRLTDPEVLESRYPVRLHRFAIRPHSGGQGRWHGGNGVIREIEALVPLDLSVLSQRRLTSPYGLCGGGDGRPGRNLLIRQGKTEPILLPPIAHATLATSDRIILETPGGGGYGTQA